MQSVEKFLALIFAVLLVAPVAAPAQVQPPPGNWLPQLPPPVLQMEQQADRFLGPDWWSDPVPGTYLVQVAGTGLCLNWKMQDTRSQVPYLRVEQCAGERADQNLELSPAAVDAPLWPATSGVRWRVNNRGECAGVARNVVLGAPRVDFNPCGMPAFTGGNPAFRGDADQHVIMIRTAQDRYRFRVADGRCWTVGGALQPGSQMQIEPCDGRAGQVFQLIRLFGVAEPTNQSAADLFGWIQIGSIEQPVGGQAAPDRFRRLSRFDLPGSDIANFETGNDRGRSCAMACAGNAQCRAFTWVQAGAQFDQPWCWLKNAVPIPVANGKMISGIVRP